jgi:hypothetical protein
VTIGLAATGSCDSSSMWNRCMVLATMSIISTSANWLPMHLCGPEPSGR